MKESLIVSRIRCVRVNISKERISVFTIRIEFQPKSSSRLQHFIIHFHYTYILNNSLLWSNNRRLIVQISTRKSKSVRIILLILLLTLLNRLNILLLQNQRVINEIQLLRWHRRQNKANLLQRLNRHIYFLHRYQSSRSNRDGLHPVRRRDMRFLRSLHHLLWDVVHLLDVHFFIGDHPVFHIGIHEVREVSYQADEFFLGAEVVACSGFVEVAF